jgi:hypothetical protein
VLGPRLLADTLSLATRTDKHGNRWQYHSRSDHHSKVACCAVVIDLLTHCNLLRRHVEVGKVAFGINHDIRDFQNNRRKSLDLVLCTPASGPPSREEKTFEALMSKYWLALDGEAEATVASLPVLVRRPVGNVLVALEAKACMTAHQKALPRLYDELNSSHLTVHGASEQAVAAGFVMVNAAETYVSPDLNKAKLGDTPLWSRHKQPADTVLVIEKIKQMPRRSRTDGEGYDALAIVVIDCRNDGSPVKVFDEFEDIDRQSIYHYDTMIGRLSHAYATRFRDV